MTTKATSPKTAFVILLVSPNIFFSANAEGFPSNIVSDFYLFIDLFVFSVLSMMPITSDGGGNPATACLPPPHSPYPPGFSAAMAAAMANQQFASLMSSQGLPFMPHAAIQAMYNSSPTSKCRNEMESKCFLTRRFFFLSFH